MGDSFSSFPTSLMAVLPSLPGLCPVGYMSHNINRQDCGGAVMLVTMSW